MIQPIFRVYILDSFEIAMHNSSTGECYCVCWTDDIEFLPKITIQLKWTGTGDAKIYIISCKGFKTNLFENIYFVSEMVSP